MVSTTELCPGKSPEFGQKTARTPRKNKGEPRLISLEAVGPEDHGNWTRDVRKKGSSASQVDVKRHCFAPGIELLRLADRRGGGSLGRLDRDAILAGGQADLIAAVRDRGHHGLGARGRPARRFEG